MSPIKAVYMLQTFTESLYKKDLRPTFLRDGSKLLSFHYFPGNAFPFAGVDDKGRSWLWKKDGHRNGKKRMLTDLVYELIDPNVLRIFVSITPSGNAFANNDLEKLRTLVKTVDCDEWELMMNLKTGLASGLKMKK